MSSFSFEEVNNIYSSSNGVIVNIHSVPSANLQTYSQNTHLLFKAIGDDGKNDFWSSVISDIKRFNFDVSAAPLSKEIRNDKAKYLYEKLKTKINYCEMVYGSEPAGMLNLLAEQARQLSVAEETNLLDFLSELVSKNQSKNLAIAICASRLIPQVEETIQKLAGLRSCEIVCHSNLRDAKCYGSIFLIGAPKWFPEYVFSSPRSKELHIIKHKWISGNWKPEVTFVSLYRSHGSKYQTIEIKDEGTDFIEDNPEELIPRIDIQNILDNALKQSVKLMESDDDVVVAKLFLLENDWAVFLDADDNSAVDIIDLDEEIKKRVRRAHVREIHPGMFILLRTEGGGDYIVPVADRIMGKFKEKARSDQKKWKTLLRDYVKREGASKTMRELRILGSNRATYLNLANWMSLRGIKTESYDDFLAIMKLIGLEKDAKKYWDTMGEIRTAHTRAGFSIRSMLLDLVNKSDLNTLKCYGKMDFELAEQGAGTLSAFRVIDVAKETVEVIHWKIGEPFRIASGDDSVIIE